MIQNAQVPYRRTQIHMSHTISTYPDSVEKTAHNLIAEAFKVIFIEIKQTAEQCSASLSG